MIVDIWHWVMKKLVKKEDDVLSEIEEMTMTSEDWDTVFKVEKKDIERDVAKTFKEELAETTVNMVDYVIKGDEIIVIIDDNNMVVDTCQSVNIEELPYVTIVRKDNAVAAMVDVTVMSKRYKVICNHVAGMLEFEELRNYTQINPQLQIMAKRINELLPKWIIVSGTEVRWMTLSLTTGKNVFITTKVRRAITAHIRTQNRTKITTVAIVVSIVMEENLVLSGTVMYVQNKPYIITLVKQITGTPVIHIVAVAPMTHNYTLVLR
jgi:hypothetical protein